MDLLEQNNLREYADPADTIRLVAAHLPLQVAGKSAKIYVL